MSGGGTWVPHACAGQCREPREREGPAVPSPLPSRGPGAPVVGIFSRDMCHLSCRGGGGRRTLLLLALCRPRSPGRWAPTLPAQPGSWRGPSAPCSRSPPPRYGRSGGPFGVGAWGWGLSGAFRVCWQLGCGPLGGEGYF